MASWRFESTDKNRLQVTESGVFKPLPYSLTTKQAIGGADCSKEASFGLPHNYNRIQLTCAACKPRLDSQLKQVIGDMDCSALASSGLPHKPG